jgi:Ca2+-binding RTX toxin-like protein
MATPTKWDVEFLVTGLNTGDKINPSVTALKNGQILVVWTEEASNLGDSSGTAIHAQILHANGATASPPFRVNSGTNWDQVLPEVTALDNGGFVVTWQNKYAPGLGNDADIHARVFDQNGSAPDPDFRVNVAFADTQGRPQITTLSNGKFVIAWTDHIGGDNNIRYQIFNESGTIFSGISTANAVMAGDQDFASIAPLSHGRFIITWETKNGANSVLTGRIFKSDGTPEAGEFQIGPIGNKDGSTITELSDGRFVAAWTDLEDGGKIHAQIYDADGKVGDELVVTAANNAYGPSIAATADGDFVITWHQLEQQTTYFDVYAQKFHANDGTKDGAPFMVNTIAAATQGTTGNPAVTLADGRIAVVYTDTSNSPDSPTGTVIRGQILDPREQGMRIDGDDDLDDQLFGTQFDDTVKGGGGADFLSSSGGDDFVEGGAGADDLYGGSGNDTASYAQSASGVTVSLQTGTGAGGDAQGDSLSQFENLLGSNHSDILTGNDGDNLIEGGRGYNTIDGRGGDDTAVFSHDFNDYMVVDYGTKIFIKGPNGIDSLTGIEHLEFANATVDVVNDGNPLFDALYYLSQNPDVFQAGMDPLVHFKTFGWQEGRDPNPWFDVSGYLAANKDVAASGMNPLDHYHQIGWQQGRDPGGSFDTSLYLLRNPDVANAGIDPLAHYLAAGAAEGRQADEAVGQNIVGGFDAQYYLFHNPDVAAAGIDPLFHFNAAGWKEGRDPNAWFDSSGYLAYNTDVKAAGINPLQHYEAVGWMEGRDPSTSFDTAGYLAANPDVAMASYNPLDHFLQHGIYEGRQAINDGMWS